VDHEAVREALRAAAAPFQAAPPPAACALLYGPLFAALAPGGPPDYPLALEFVYEGYLAHYRSPRLLAADTTPATRLLAGDHFDASGLRLVARRGDLDAVRLLTRLMASCSWLRSEDQPFAYDDDLWALCVAGIASNAAGGNAFTALRGFDEVASLFARGRAERLPDVVRRAAGGMWFADPAPLLSMLGLAPAREGAAAEVVEPPDEAGGIETEAAL